MEILFHKKRQYNHALQAFSQNGNRYAMIPRLTALGKFAGLSAEDIIEDVRALGVKDRDADIRRMWNGSRAQANSTCAWHRSRPKTRPAKPTPKRYATLVDKLIAESKDTPHEVLMRLSPVNVEALSPRESAEAMLRAMFAPNDLVLVGTMKQGIRKRNLRRRDEWLKSPYLLYHRQVKINPLTGRYEDGGNGKTMFGKKCIADHRYALLEFDNLSLDAQEKFWCSVVKQNVLPVVAIVYSASKSFHGLIYIGAQDFDKWKTSTERLCELFCSATDASKHADEQALKSPIMAIRLAGATRKEFEKDESSRDLGAQVLHYLNPYVVPHNKEDHNEA